MQEKSITDEIYGIKNEYFFLKQNCAIHSEHNFFFLFLTSIKSLLTVNA